MFYKILFPFSYFMTSRLIRSRDWAFMSFYEWGLNIGLVFLLSTPSNSIKNILFWLLSYLGFISLYEIGYIFNDLISVRYETHPRKRLGNYNPNTLEFSILIGIRLIFFSFFTYMLSHYFDMKMWWVLMGALVLLYILHNTIQYKPHKIITFFQLAFIRIIAPIVLVLSADQLAMIIPVYILCYVFYRSLIYMEHKYILTLDNRRTMKYTVGYYVLLLPVLSFLSLFFDSFIPIIIGGYFISVWFTLFYFGRKFQ